ncbi:DUF4062 domain-containing protein [Photobacterium leiognathi]|uniref:DUF4062 domain-containing protein n=1 Tax=Photobacterium leiognathi TaxID=553611 RepID=UPI000208866D|nr:DUF4062 domain-containing protein [Photobacterium leiognathi]PSW54961.1 DUF4062 domain-containing protein [Photobacterium leiognathi subsp. mandapamensis]GAA06456.1 putative uncharacterized protein [Photobacterium leiognathi subsp. mandapamensis svers.1.1.]
MARPRVFVSSTYYDLKYVRADLQRFIENFGYDPVLNEKGHIPYGSDDKLESYCYKEIDLCDIVIGIVGGRFGSDSFENKGYSVSNVELQSAIKKGKQLYVFVDQQVMTEYRTYQANKENESIVYPSVDNPKVFKFIDELFELPNNNQIQSFSSVLDIINHLKEQWAGLFQRLLSEEIRKRELDIIDEINSTSSTLKSLVTYLTKEKNKGNKTIENILLNNHPAFEDLRRKISLGHRIFFQNKKELREILESYGYNDIDFLDVGGLDYVKNGINVTISGDIFDEHQNLKIFTPDNWNDEFIEIKNLNFPPRT